METLSVNGKRSNVRRADESSKLPRAEDQIDVHTRLPLLSDLMEVFSVRFVDFKHHDFEQMYGCILIGALPNYIVFSRKDSEPLNIDSMGFVKLWDPDRIIEPSDCIDLYPHLFRYQACVDQFKNFETKLLWNNRIYQCFDTFMSRKVSSQFGEIEVNYVVYRCGVVAHVDVTLSGCQFPSATTVHGLITAQNSKLGEKGKSILFDRVDGEGISIEVSPCKDRIAQLPLAKCKTALPYHSSLTVDVNIWQCSNIGEPDKAIVKNEKFEFVAQLSGQEVVTFRGAACQVNVAVTWSHY
ncbi:hypothetical protein LUZ63_004183 [Rhynchospora breviuscula]|uniref:DUF6598 domain-containing protein n=1 Tax=Rhynchospora breviuscula TaxID=2022672 RepID=A0A9Q0D414_9POAL|nr:hypothetical protein LUZ63_004183 [Rhynchospora breviuscula]